MEPAFSGQVAKECLQACKFSGYRAFRKPLFGIEVVQEIPQKKVVNGLEVSIARARVSGAILRARFGAARGPKVR